MTREQPHSYTFASADEPFRLLSGADLPRVTLAYETWGELAPARDNAVWITPGLSASTHVARHHPDDAPGWWDEMIGPGRFIDTDHWFVICANVLGGCFGSTGPTATEPRTGRPYGPDFPTVTPEDMVAAFVALQDHLHLPRLRCVLGASMGGMLALQWAAGFPERVASVCGIATPGRSHAFSIAWRAVQREIVTSDPAFEKGRYPAGRGPVDGLNRARKVGILSYRSPQEFDPRFGRDFADADLFDRGGRFEVEAYLDHNAAKFGTLFDANSYLVLARAMDLFDLGRGAASYEEGVARISSPALIVGFSSDQLFPVEQQREVWTILRQNGRQAALLELDTPFGHDAFLIEIDALGSRLARFLESRRTG